MAIFKSISSISNSTSSLKTSIFHSNVDGLISNGNSVACFDGDMGGWGGFNGFNGCGGSRNTNIINLDIDIGRRNRRCC
ncbi:hypothetical protein RB653_010413 [Dictyostelium firmibasis]|uniref:Uncharacterized protein n=1 Tax=Dictyostelium firmibasis TaxID=79012 RepID=A0AAN7TSU1_9MYCE